MKKIFYSLLTIFTILFVNSNSYAQWSSKYYRADPLTGTEECFIDSFTDKNGNTFTSQSNHETLRIYTTKGIFNYDIHRTVHLIIGFYVGHMMIEKKDVWFHVPTDKPQMAYSDRYKQKKISRKIKQHLKTKGSIRIIADIYGDDDLDITIPMNKNLK